MTDISLPETVIPDETQIKDDIRVYSSSKYNSIIKTASKELYEKEGVQFVGQFGSTSVPGASDIDLLVVVDEEMYQSVHDFSKHLVKRNSDYKYLFWHKPTIVPKSLIKEISILHTLDNLQPLYGDEAIFEHINARVQSEELGFIQASVWNSFFWRTLSSLSKGTHSLRKLLLVLSNTVQSAATNYRIVNRHEYAQNILNDLKQNGRREIINLDQNKRAEVMISYLQESIKKLYSSEWTVQEYYFNQYGNNIYTDRSDYLVVGQGLVPNRGTTFHFIDNLNNTNETKIQSKKRFFTSTNQIILPSYYLTTLPSIISAFDIDRLACSLPLADGLQSTINNFCETIHNVRQVSKRIFNDEFKLFQDTFIIPFGLTPYDRFYQFKKYILNLFQQYLRTFS